MLQTNNLTEVANLEDCLGDKMRGMKRLKLQTGNSPWDITKEKRSEEAQKSTNKPE